MVRALMHRGPDSHGQVVRESSDWHIGLGNTRLAILDLSSDGAQPMAGSRSPCWLTYNGETYNFADLRRELQSQGYEFQSQADSEVVLRAYEAWGVEAIARLRGMFGFGLWDERFRRLILARDPLGIKPVYYYAAKNVFLFASEVRALLATGLVSRRLDLEGLASYLQYGSIAAPRTIIEGVRSLLPGRYLIAGAKEGRLQLEEVSYADDVFSGRSGDPKPRREEVGPVLRRILEESVRLHLVSDVPLGVFLSGGIDSSAVVALMSRVADEKPRTFSVVTAEEGFSEAPYARLVAKEYGTAHQEIALSESELLGLLPAALAAMDQPTSDGVNTFVISKAVREAGVTVALSGLGGDELFGGYPSFHRVLRLQMAAKLPRGFRRAAAAVGRGVFQSSGGQGKLWELIASDGSPDAVYAISRRLFAPEEILEFLGGDLGEPRIAGDDDDGDLINSVSRCELQGYMANTLLRDTDCMSMAHALEVRVPFVDAVVVRYVLGLPGGWKVDGRRPKPFLLDALADLIPVEVWKRPKMGFTLPFERWMRSSLGPLLDDALSDNVSLARLGINPKLPKRAWLGFKRNVNGERWSRPWALYVVAKWCELNEVSA